MSDLPLSTMIDAEFMALQAFVALHTKEAQAEIANLNSDDYLRMVEHDAAQRARQAEGIASRLARILKEMRRVHTWSEAEFGVDCLKDRFGDTRCPTCREADAALADARASGLLKKA